jgi:hypothetical protein
MTRILYYFPVLFFLWGFSQLGIAQENFKHCVGLSLDGIHTWTKTFNIHQNVMSATYDLSPGVTLSYDLIIKEKFFMRAKAGYYYIVNHADFPGEFPLIDHSMKRISRHQLDAFPIGINMGLVHNVNDRWQINVYLGLSSYYYYGPIPSGTVEDLNEYLRVGDGVRLTGRIVSGSVLYTYGVIHSWEMGHTITYRLKTKAPFSIFLNNYLKIGFDPYINFDTVLFTTGLPGEDALWNSTSSFLSTLFFTSLGIQYGF